MILSKEITYLLLITMVAANVFIFLFLIYRKSLQKRRYLRKLKILDTFTIFFETMDRKARLKLFKLNKDIFLKAFIDVSQRTQVSSAFQEAFKQTILESKLPTKLIKGLKASDKLKRIESASLLGYIKDNSVKQALEDALLQEKEYCVKLYIVNSLIMIGESTSYPTIILSAKDAPFWYAEKTAALLASLGKDLERELISNSTNTNASLTYFVICLSAEIAHPILKQNLEKHIIGDDEFFRKVAVDSYAKRYTQSVFDERFLTHRDDAVVRRIIEALSGIPTREVLERLIDFLGTKHNEEAARSISKILQNNREYVLHIFAHFTKEENSVRKKALSAILAIRVEFFILRLNTRFGKECKSLLRNIIGMKKLSGIITFLNSNSDIEIENEVLDILNDEAKNDESIRDEMREYLSERILSKINLTPTKKTYTKKKGKSGEKRFALIAILIFSLALFPSIYLVINYENIGNLGVMETIKRFVISSNYYFAYYSAALNLFMVILLIASFVASLRQIRYWSVKDSVFMFKPKVLPSVSIIAPAYNEEATIIESANSLMNLVYPDYEVIVVNDGSKDSTLTTLIDYFELEKTDVYIDKRINTMAIRGVYTNASYPKLMVIDKANGGKADSLNAGLNAARKDYVCGIDADSLLESESLLKITAPFMDYDYENTAIGGNIIPINNCEVENGMLSSIRIPKTNLARFQMVEYIRAFMAGRIGWAALDCLLIISGAFGLFKKKRVIEAGGYLTSSGKYEADTVGEDMELVVRLTRLMKEKKKKFKISYSSNANCWTEVPESFNMLSRQRDRWQRGLIDVMFFHRLMLGNPKYGSAGVFAFPYFLIFEIIGPLLEAQGYIFVISAGILGLLNAQIASLLFVFVILTGIFTTIFSFFIAENQVVYFKGRELAVLVLYCILESFGFRQVMSFFRVTGFFTSLKEVSTWGEMARKGFKKRGAK